MSTFPLAFFEPGAAWSIAVIIAIVGLLTVRIQRERQQYLLSRLALEKGLTSFPNATPSWLRSLRGGVVALALGIGLLGAGIVGLALTPSVPEPPPATLPAESQPRNFEQPEPPPPPPGREPELRRDGPPGGPGAPRDHRPMPPRPRFAFDPRFEKWRRAEDQRILCATTTAAGGVLALLGVALTGMALYERRIAEQIKGNP